jgi:predicted Zn-ribbon and HTH transcriptional regulator
LEKKLRDYKDNEKINSEANNYIHALTYNIRADEVLCLINDIKKLDLSNVMVELPLRKCSFCGYNHDSYIKCPKCKAGIGN